MAGGLCTLHPLVRLPRGPEWASLHRLQRVVWPVLVRTYLLEFALPGT